MKRTEASGRRRTSNKRNGETDKTLETGLGELVHQATEMRSRT